MKPLEVATKAEALWNSVDQLHEKVTKEVHELQKQCEHEWTFQSDPSGNNDSGWSCLCGVWSRRNPVQPIAQKT